MIISRHSPISTNVLFTARSIVLAGPISFSLARVQYREKKISNVTSQNVTEVVDILWSEKCFNVLEILFIVIVHSAIFSTMYR